MGGIKVIMSTSNMASEIDPILVRALNLLHSKHPKALEQLCALRDEVLGKKPDYVPEVSNHCIPFKNRKCLAI